MYRENATPHEEHVAKVRDEALAFEARAWVAANLGLGLCSFAALCGGAPPWSVVAWHFGLLGGAILMRTGIAVLSGGW